MSARSPALPVAVALALAVTVTATWWWGVVRINLSPRQMRQPLPPVSLVNVAGDLRFAEITEDGVPLGPRLESRNAVRTRAEGWSQLAFENQEGGDRATLLVFVSSDASSPLTNGRRYAAAYRLREQPASRTAVLLTWCLALAVAAALRRRPVHRGLPAEGPPVARWSVVAAVGLYSLFVLRAQLVSASSLVWLAALLLVALPALLAVRRPPPAARPVWPWLGGLLLWMWLTTMLPGAVDANPRSALAATAGCALGTALVLAFRHRLGSGATGSAALLVSWAGTALGLVLTVGHMGPLLALQGLGVSTWASGVWSEKYAMHWLLLLAWCVLLAFSRKPSAWRTGTVVVLVGTLSVLWFGASKSGLAALLCSLAVAGTALLRPRATRRALVAGVLAAVLLAPLLYRVPWQVHRRLPPAAAEMSARYLESSVRGAIWEAAGRFVMERPWAGRGIGAAARMAAGRVPLGEQLGIDPVQRTPAQQSYPALPGGHPHSLPLLIWLDLGLVGALLCAGLIMALGRVMSRAEEQSRAHACLLGLFTATVVLFAVNYPVWDPVVLSLLWFGPALAGGLRLRQEPSSLAPDDAIPGEPQ